MPANAKEGLQMRYLGFGVELVGLKKAELEKGQKEPISNPRVRTLRLPCLSRFLAPL